MKRALSVVSAAFGFSIVVMAASSSWTGTVVDVMCKNKDLANHTAKCAVSCAKGGYGLVLSDGKFVKFDETGNAKALAALKTTSKEKDIKAKVTGSLDEDVIKVETIEFQ
ncbi:MAG TPA: hypothetical protein VMZ52_13550 [Bryobacteraceae bacterium]|nr:hypothetical protein [Bryobacteraceae bacterium]